MQRLTFTGAVCAAVTAACFGLIPLFTKPMQAAGLSVPVILFYRFLFTSAMLFLIPRREKFSWKLNSREYIEISCLSILYCICAAALFASYHYINSGLATALAFLYPVFTALVMCIFFGEKPGLETGAAVFCAVAGATMISIRPDSGFETADWKGIALATVSAASYGIYLVLIKQFSINSMPNIKLNAFIFGNGILYYGFYLLCSGGIPCLHSVRLLLLAAGLAFITTVVANITLVKAVKEIGSTYTSILGAFEPVTALTAGYFAFNERITVVSCAGVFLVISAVLILLMSPMVKKLFRDRKNILMMRLRHNHTDKE